MGKITKEDGFVESKKYKLKQQTFIPENILEADKSYMQDEDALEGWMFVNYIAMHWYYKLILKLKENKMNSKFSPKDIILF